MFIVMSEHILNIFTFKKITNIEWNKFKLHRYSKYADIIIEKSSIFSTLFRVKNNFEVFYFRILE